MRPCLHKQAGWDPSYTGGIGGLWSRANPRQEGNALSKTYAKKGWGAAQMIESLPSKSKAPSSNPSTTKKKNATCFWGVCLPMHCSVSDPMSLWGRGTCCAIPLHRQGTWSTGTQLGPGQAELPTLPPNSLWSTRNLFFT
jgi:hypothetical protein